MLKIVLGVVVGFISWTILFLGTDEVLIMASPGWYGVHQTAFDFAVGTQQPFKYDTTILIIHLVRTAIISVMSGFLAAVIAGENRKTPLVLGVVLLIVGIGVQASVWSYLPVWYHLVFLLSLIPFTILGGKIKQTA